MRPQALPRRLRHIKYGRTEDRAFGSVTNLPHLPSLPDGEVYVYGGLVHDHFGHLAGEYLHRLWVLDHLDEQATVLLPAHLHDRYCPSYLQPLLDYMGVKKWLFIREPVMVPNLVIPEQAIRLGEGWNHALDSWVERLADRHRISGPSSGAIALTRTHNNFRPLVGEERLDDLLISEGYYLFKPEEHPLVEQLKTLYNADRIVQADGSTCHLWDLLPKSNAEVFFYGSNRRGFLDKTRVAPKVKRLVSYTSLKRHQLTLKLNNKAGQNIQFLTANQHELTVAMRDAGMVKKALPKYTIHRLREEFDLLALRPNNDALIATFAHYVKINGKLDRRIADAALSANHPGFQRKLKMQVRDTIQKYIKNIGAWLRLF